MHGMTKGNGVNKYLQDAERLLDLQEYTVKNPAKVLGRSGVSHDVDIYGEDSSGRRFIIEFVFSDDLVSEEEVIRLYAIRFDTKVDEMMMVTHSGLTEKVEKLAKLYGIWVLNTSGRSGGSEFLR